MKAKVKTWLRNIENGNIKGFAERILKTVKEATPDPQGYLFIGHKEGIDTHKLRKDLSISHQSLTAVLSNLCDEGLIRIVGQKSIKDSTYSVFMYVYDLEYRKRLIILRKEERFLNWLKKADDYSEFMDNRTIQMLSCELEDRKP